VLPSWRQKGSPGLEGPAESRRLEAVLWDALQPPSTRRYGVVESLKTRKTVISDAFFLTTEHQEIWETRKTVISVLFGPIAQPSIHHVQLIYTAALQSI
jgi:hypothetical protein